MEQAHATTSVDTTPFFIAAGEGKGVSVSKATARPPSTENGVEVYELLDARELGEIATAAELLGEIIGKADTANPLLADEDWAHVATEADREGVAMLFSAPPSQVPSLVEIAAVTKGLRADWIAELVSERDASLFDAGAAIWKCGGRTFASRRDPPVDPRVVLVRSGAVPTRTDLKVSNAKATHAVRLFKDAAEQRFVLGVVLEPEVTDSQGDVYSAEEIRRAAHTFMENYQNVGFQHQTLVNGAVRIVESYLAPVDFETPGGAAKAGSWLLGLHVLDDELWRRVRSGELTGLSIGGFAQRVPA